MKLKYLLFTALLIFVIPCAFAFTGNNLLNLKQTQKEIENMIIDNQVQVAKQEMQQALETIPQGDPINFGRVLRKNIKLLPQQERISFLKSLRTQAQKLDVLDKIDWYFLVEESLAKTDFNASDAAKSATKFVDKLHSTLLSGSPRKFERATRVLKQDMIKLVSQGDADLLEAFINAYSAQASKYPAMKRSITLFLTEMTNNHLPLKLMKSTSVPSESLARNTLPALMQHFSWTSFIIDNQDIILQDLFKNQTYSRFYLSNLSQILSRAYTNAKVAGELDKAIMSRVAILNDLAKRSLPDYEKMKATARYGKPGQRDMLRLEALENNFGELSPHNAKSLAKMLQEVQPSQLEKVLPNAKGWIRSFSKWADKAIKTKGNNILTVGAMVAVVIAEELIRNYTAYNPSDAYLSIIDEITDTVAEGNNIKLVYNTVYNEDFAKHFITYAEEGNLTEQEQLAYMKTYDDFESALYAQLFTASEDSINEQVWQCFALNENCADEA